jgi:predicted membrane GTPase involved in stress response
MLILRPALVNRHPNAASAEEERKRATEAALFASRSFSVSELGEAAQGIHELHPLHRAALRVEEPRADGSLVADRAGAATSFALLNLQERDQLFIAPGAEVYEGMVVGENARAEDLDVNETKEKKLTNMRSSTAEELVRLIPPRPLSLEQALELIREDECVEVTPGFIRLRKVELAAQKRQTAASRKARGLAAV